MDETIMVTQGGVAEPHRIDSLFSLALQEGEFEVLCENASFGTVDEEAAIKIYEMRPNICDDKAKEKLIELIEEENERQRAAEEFWRGLGNIDKEEDTRSPIERLKELYKRD